MVDEIPDRAPVDPLDIVLVGAGERARGWLEPLRRSARLRLVATVARSDESAAPDVVLHRSLDAGLAAHPDAVFAVALPPRAGTAAALRLAAVGRNAIVEAPLHDGLVESRLPPEAAAVRVAHGWVTLAGRLMVGKVLQRLDGGRLSIEIAGLPESPRGEVAECLVHALALLRSLLPAAAVVAAEQRPGELDVELADGGWTASLRVRPHGRRLVVRVDGAAGPVVWSWQDDRESVMRGDRALLAPRPSPSAAVRALAQLLPGASGGDGLAEAAAVLRLARDVRERCATPLPPSGRPLRQSASIATRRPDDLLGRLGLAGEVPDAGSPPAVIAPALPPEPFELWAFRAGIKPVVFLTVHPRDVETTLLHFGDAHHERRERRVSVGSQDRWTDRRDEGDQRVELYIARDPELARRAAHLQAEGDPTAALREIGGLVGYPACCIAAFAAQDDRANNSLNRYYSQARTVAVAAATAVPWPWELNNLHTMIAPFYPCSYRCGAALAWARTSLDEMRNAHPMAFDELRSALRQPVLYFDHDHQIVFDGRVAGDQIEYQGVTLGVPASPRFAALAAVVADGNRLVLGDETLIVERDGRCLLRLSRTDPGLGFVAPFGSEDSGVSASRKLRGSVE